MALRPAYEKVHPKKSYFSSSWEYVKLPFSLGVAKNIFIVLVGASFSKQKRNRYRETLKRKNLETFSSTFYYYIHVYIVYIFSACKMFDVNASWSVLQSFNVSQLILIKSNCLA
jgi:hypothetical protein